MSVYVSMKLYLYIAHLGLFGLDQTSISYFWLCSHTAVEEISVRNEVYRKAAPDEFRMIGDD